MGIFDGVFSGVFGEAGSKRNKKNTLPTVDIHATVDKNDPQARISAGNTIIVLLESNEFSEAEESARNFSGIFGEEFLYFYLPISIFFKKLKNTTGDIHDLEKSEDFKFGINLVSAASRMPPNFALTEEQVQGLVRAINNLKNNQKNEHKTRYALYERTNSTQQLDEFKQIKKHLVDGCSAIFVYKCVAENFAVYKEFKEFSTGLGLNNDDYAIPGPKTASPSSEFSFMKSLTDKSDATSLFSVYNLIYSYQNEQKNKVSVDDSDCAATINLNNGFWIFAKTCKIQFSFTGKDSRNFTIKGKINLKKYPELLEKAKSFSLWKVAEGKPVITVNFSLQNDEFKQKISEISEIVKTINTENDEIKSVLTAK